MRQSSGSRPVNILNATIRPGEQRQAVLLDGEPLEDVDKFKYLGSIWNRSPDRESSATFDGEGTG